MRRESDKQETSWTRLWAGVVSEDAEAEEFVNTAEVYGHWYWTMRDRWRRRLYQWNRKSPGDCEATVFPELTIAGRRATLKFVIAIGESGIADGGRIAIWFPPFCGVRDLYNIRVVQDITQPPGYGALVTASASRAGVLPKLRIHSVGTIGLVLEILVESGSLMAGDTVTVVVGDPQAKRFMVQEFAQEMVFSIAVDRDGSGDWRRVKEYPTIKVVGDVAHEFKVTGPTTSEIGMPFTLRLTAADRVNNNPSWFYRGESCLEALEKGLMLPESVSFKEEDHGVLRVPGIRCESADTQHVLVLDKELGICGRSNPMCAGFAGQFNIYFGDIHAHTGLTQGSGNIDEHFQWARDVEHLDFCADADYYHPGGNFHVPAEEKWRTISDAVERYNSPGEFVTLPGYETSNPDGHRNVYFRSMDEAIYPGPDQPRRWPTRQALFDATRERNCIIIPHHPKVGVPIDWDYPDQPLECLLEIYSFQGWAESDGPHSAQAALARGHHFGFIAGSDNHVSQPGHHQRYFGEGGGLAAIFAENLSREGVFDALQARRCYAVTGARILLDFRINGHWMGQEIMTQSPREITVRVIGAWPIESAEIIRNNSVLATRPGDGEEIVFEYIDSEPIVNETFYYARVKQADGHMAWSSPIWVKP
jgi:hypothetical protein